MATSSSPDPGDSGSSENEQRTVDGHSREAYLTRPIAPCDDDGPTADTTLSEIEASTRSGSSSRPMPSCGSAPALLLIDADLWGKFHGHHNEMILTKSGRCLFPCLRFKAVNLDQDALYTIRLDFERLDPRRFRFCNGTWVVTSSKSPEDGSSAQEGRLTPALSRESYTHPDMYQTGKVWMQGPISFANVKLSNALPESDASLPKWGSKGDDIRGSNHLFHMASFAKYRPRVHLTQRSRQSHGITFSATYTFERTAFVAVTHYQNHRVNDLKKANNPHAKGFRDTIGTRSTPLPRKRRHLNSHLPEPPGEHKPKKRFRSGSVSTKNETDGSEGNMRENELLESNGEWFSMGRCISGEVRPRSEKSTVVTLLLRKDIVPVTNLLKDEWERRPAKEPLADAPCTLQTRRWKGMEARTDNLSPLYAPGVGVASNTQESRVLGTFDYHRARSSEQTSASTAFEPMEEYGWLNSPLAPATEFDRPQEILSGTSPIPQITQPGYPGTYIDTAPASLFHIPNPVTPGSTFGSHPSLVLDHLSTPSVNHMGIGAASLVNSTAPAFAIPKLATKPSISWYQQFLTPDRPPSDLTLLRTASPALSVSTQYSTDTARQLSLELVMGQIGEQKAISDRVPLDIPRQHQQERRARSTPALMLSELRMNTESGVIQGTSVLNNPPLPGPQPVVPSLKVCSSSLDIRNVDLPMRPDPRTPRATILESKTFMSASSVISLSPCSAYPIQAYIDQVLRENLCLRAFIRERYGQEAEADANAVLAMKCHKQLKTNGQCLTA